MGGTPWSVVASWTFEVRFAEGHELARDLYATFGVGVDDHTQRTVEVVTLFSAQLVHLLGREGFVGAQYATSASANVEEEVEKAMANDGIYIVPIEAMVEDMIEQECASWDTTTLGTPPPEWDCPGY